MKPAGHPRSLYVLFFTEMWERFGYYLMLALFVFYLTEHLKMSTAEATSLYGTYTGLVYLAPLLGGLFADRLLGHRRAVLAGAFLMGLGYLTLAIDQRLAMYAAMGLIVLGNGLFKPNISAMVGGLYPAGDPRRDSAFGIFYLGVNIGALFAPLAAGYMRSNYGWSYAFATAGVGMFIGMIIFAIAGRHLGARPVLVSAAAAQPEEEVAPAVAKERVRALLMMCGIVIFFWVCFQQNGSTLALWARDNTDLTLGGRLSSPIDPAMFAAVNSFFIIVLTPALLFFFRFLRTRGLEPSTPAKLGLGMLLTAVSCGMMVMASLVGGDKGRVSALWLVSSYFVVTLGELCLSPIGLSMVTKLAPRRAVALMLGFWYLGTAIGNKMAGEIGVFWDRWQHHEFFTLLAVGSLGAAGILALNLRRLRAAMPPDRPQAPRVVQASVSTVTAVVTVAAVEQQLAELAKADSATSSDAHPVLSRQRANVLPS